MSHPHFEKASSLTETIIGASIEVHRDKGPGLESICEWCMEIELSERGLHYANQCSVSIDYKGHRKQEDLKFDLLVESCVLLELKAVETIHPIHKAQLLSYMKLMNIPVGLLINFNTTKLTNGVYRLNLPEADT